ncbi:MAG: helix-turn-helix transcriptional regulator [Tepidisphaeraceae bacterium]
MTQRIAVPPPTLPSLRTDEPLLWFAGGEHETWRDSSYFYDSRVRDDPPHAVLQLTLGGSGYYRRGGESRTLLPAGWAFCDMIPGHFEYGWAGGTYELIFISFAGQAAVRWVEHIHAHYGPTLDLGRDESVRQTMLGLVESAHAGLLRDRYLISGQLYGLLMQVLSVLARSRIAATPLVAECLQIIQSEASSPTLNVNGLADRLNRSREHLTREFRDATGISPSTYLTQTRVRLAAGELRSTDAKLTAIAHRSGFGSAEYLCRVFRKTVGVTPVQFRDRPWLVVP